MVLAGQKSEEKATVPSGLNAVHLSCTPAARAQRLVMMPVSVASPESVVALTFESE